MIIISIWLFWSFISISIGAAVWRKFHGGIKVYALIAVSGIYLSGIFMFYGLVNHTLIW